MIKKLNRKLIKSFEKPNLEIKKCMQAEEIIIVHSNNDPFTDKQEEDKFIRIAKYLKEKISSKIKLYIIPHGETLSSYKLNCENRFTCILFIP